MVLSNTLLIIILFSTKLSETSSLHIPGYKHRASCRRSFSEFPPSRIITNRQHTVSPPNGISRLLHSSSTDDTINDEIFGAEFSDGNTGKTDEEKTYWRGNIQYTEISPEKRGKVMKGYDNLRITFLLDNLFISALGLCLLWSFGTYKDAFSYGVGSFLGLGYAALLARYVESLGSKQGGGAGGGAARFAPVVLLILLYSKNKEYISIVPEILGFFTFQVASLLQIFNQDAYGESGES
jgi:hypothetical protein